MKLSSLILLIFISFTSLAQAKFVPLEDLKNHVGDTVRTHGMVVTAEYFPDSTNAPTFLNFGKELLVVIWGKDRKNFPKPPEDVYEGQLVEITGKIDLFNGRPRIILTNRNAIVFLAVGD